MKFLLVVVFLSIFILTQANDDHHLDNNNNDDNDDDIDAETGSISPTTEIVATIITSVLGSQSVQNKLQKIYDLIDLKIRFLKLFNSLLTRENFILLRRLLDLIARICNYFASFLPEPDTNRSNNHNNPSFISTLFNLGITPNRNERNPRLLDFPTTTTTTTKPEDNEIVTKQSLTKAEQQLIEQYHDDVINVAQLIHNNRRK